MHLNIEKGLFRIANVCAVIALFFAINAIYAEVKDDYSAHKLFEAHQLYVRASLEGSWDSAELISDYKKCANQKKTFKFRNSSHEASCLDSVAITLDVYERHWGKLKEKDRVDFIKRFISLFSPYLSEEQKKKVSEILKSGLIAKEAINGFVKDSEEVDYKVYMKDFIRKKDSEYEVKNSRELNFDTGVFLSLLWVLTPYVLTYVVLYIIRGFRSTDPN